MTLRRPPFGLGRFGEDIKRIIAEGKAKSAAQLVRETPAARKAEGGRPKSDETSETRKLSRGGNDRLVAVRKEITKTQAIRERRASHPDETQQATADAVGCSQQMVAKIDRALTTESSETEQKVVIPDWITHQDIRAAFRKLPADERERLEGLPADRRRGAVRAAAVAAGIIRVIKILNRWLT